MFTVGGSTKRENMGKDYDLTPVCGMMLIIDLI